MEIITFEKAYKTVINSAFTTGTETVSFSDSLYRILAEDISSDMDMPPFNRSAVDGFACNRIDIVNHLEVIEVIPAGKEPARRVGKNQCSKIMTGAIVPDGCDIVFMVEDSEKVGSGKIRFTGRELKTNISFKAEDVSTGDLVLKNGKFIKPQDIAVMASVGHTNVTVKKKPQIGILSTGDELVEPSCFPAISQIRNSNGYQLLSQVSRAGGSGRYYGIAPDVEDITFEMIQKAIDENDILILTGGVSMGDFDFVPAVLKQAGVNILFDQVNVKPGKPTVFGVHPNALVFGLPGNPVSSFIQFETLVRPLINKMMGYDWKPYEQKLKMAVSYERKSQVRMGWVPVIITGNGEVEPVDFHGSAHISALPCSDGIIAVKAGTKFIEKGEIVSVRQI
ncbi:MAG: molybdopterin molybdenumtransferase MoeA [Odoribacter sp.]|nr:molybdopterin molybdenumtransferase MoeA [Odoribacter sp.]